MTYLRARVSEDVSPYLVDKLRDLGDEYGPLDVAITAANLTDPNVLVGKLTGKPPVGAGVCDVTVPDLNKLRADGILAEPRFDPDLAQAFVEKLRRDGILDERYARPETPHNLDTPEGRQAFLSGNVDARDWASAWIRAASEIAAVDATRLLDYGWMIGWFANAIEAGREAGRRDALAGQSTVTLRVDTKELAKAVDVELRKAMRA